MNDEALVLNDLTRYGLRRMHVIRMDKPVNKDDWFEEVPIQAMGTALWYAQVDADGWHHLWLVWKAREAVYLQFPDGVRRNAVMWWIGKGGPSEEVEEQIRQAREYYLAVCNREGTVLNAPWVPKGFVVITEVTDG